MRLRFSRRITDMQYNADKMVLTITFNSGIEKTYLDVPEEVYKKLSNSAEKTSFMQRT